MVSLIAAALLLFLVGGLLDLIAGVSSTAVRAAPYVLTTAASALLVLVGAAGVVGPGVRFGLDSVLGSGPLGFAPIGLSVDQLSGLFLLISFTVAVPICVVCASWVARPGRVQRRGLAGAHCLALGSVALIMTADNVFLFVLAWELLTVAFYLLAGFERGDPAHAEAAIVTVVLGKASGAALLLGFLLLASRASGFTFADLASVPRSGLRDTAFALLVGGVSLSRSASFRCTCGCRAVIRRHRAH